MIPSGAILAAGAVCWKVVDKEVRILLVHRTQHKDISIPKGKLDEGETLPETAVREIREETGLDIVLGPSLGGVEYKLPGNGKRKYVHYWAAEVDPTKAERSPFQSNDEIYALEWVSLEKAATRLSYAHDVQLIRRFEQLYKAGQARTFPVVVVRHGKAVPVGNWDGPDSNRPLLNQGMKQARAIAGGLAAYAPEVIYSSTATRCLNTIAPLTYKLETPVKPTDKIAQDNYDPAGATVARFVEKRLEKQRAVVLCSHGPIIPQIVSELIRQADGFIDPIVREAASPGTGDFAVFHIAVGKDGPHIVSVESHQAP